MEVCPYCGEEVPEDSSSCWKCGTELSGGGGDGAPTIEQRGKSRDRPVAACPHCNADNVVGALRCNECGRALTAGAQAARWPAAMWTSLGLVTVVTLVALVVAFARGRPAAADPGRDQPLGYAYRDLERIYLKGGGSAARRAALWDAEHRGRFVEWEGVVLGTEPLDRCVLLAESGMATAPQVVLELKDAASLPGLKKDKQIRYSARLDEVRDGRFYLSLGVVLDE